MQTIRRITALLAIIILIVLAYSTFVEQAYGSIYTYAHIYGTTWFFVMWALMLLASLTIYLHYVHKRQYSFRLSIISQDILHLSFVMIFIGAMVTHFFGMEGIIHLRESKPENSFQNKRDGSKQKMPITLTLKKFHIDYNPGTQAPSNFISNVVWHDTESNISSNATISMNNILNTRGYRFYQSSFDNDHRGTILTVNHDPWGIAITYMGYLMAAISMLLTIFSPKSTFRKLLAHPAMKKSLAVFLLLFSNIFLSSVVNSQYNTVNAARQVPTISIEKGKELARKQVIYNDRVTPFSTVAHDFLKKIYGKDSYKGLTAEQVLLGWMMRPDAWKAEKMIKIKNGELRKDLGIEGKYAAMEDLFSADGTYKIQKYIDPSIEIGANKAVTELDEKAGFILLAVNGQLVKPIPSGIPHLSESKVTAEIIYNTIPFTKILFMVNLTVGFMLFIFLTVKGTLNRYAIITGNITLAISLLAMSFVYAIRWYISGRIPLANGYETMIFLSLTIMLITIFLQHKLTFLLPFGLLLSGFTLLVSHLGQMNPQISPLMPVLHSPLLSSHVSTIMIAYALLAIITFNSIYAIALSMKKNKQREIQQLYIFSSILLYPATFLLGIGIMLGAVWANVSWGKYWSWDPKETWALITFIIYAIALHRKTIAFLQKPINLHIFLFIAFTTVLMTYFGVNYFLGGMHSYA